MDRHPPAQGDICVGLSGSERRFLPLVVVNLAPALGLGSEVEKQADLEFCGFQVIEQLGFVLWHQGLRGLDLDDNEVVEYQVGGIFPNLFPFELDADRKLLLDLEPEFPGRYRHGVLVDLLEETVPELVVDLVERIENAVRDFLMLEHAPNVSPATHPFQKTWPTN